MEYNDKTRETITLTIIIVGLAELVLGAIAIRYADARFVLILMMIILLVICIFRVKNLIEEEELAQLAQVAKNASLTNNTLTNPQPATQSEVIPEGLRNYYMRLKRLAREYELGAQNQEFTDFSSIKEIGESLRAYAAMRGITISEEMVKDLLVAMASSRCIFVKETRSNTEDILSVIEEFFSGLERGCGEFTTPLIQSSDLMATYKDNAPVETEFFKKVYSALFFSNSISVCAMKNLGDCNFGYVFGSFIQLFKKPSGKTTYHMSQVHVSQNIPKITERKLELPNNLWCFFLVGDDFVMPKDSALWATTLEVYGDGCKNTEPMRNEKILSFAQFHELVEATYDEYFIPLDIWKKFDRVEEYLNASVNFTVANPLARQIECLTTMHIAYGASPVQAMDIAIARKILPLLAGYTAEQINQESGTLRELLDGLFGIENIPECLQAMSSLQLD